jgi:hypothetical protein
VIPAWVKLAILAAIVVGILGAVAAWRHSLIEQGAEGERAGWVKRDLDAAQDAGKETHRRLERQEVSNRETANRAAAAAAALRRERASSGQLRDELEAATAARRSGDPAAVAQCAPAEADRDLHANLSRWTDDAAGELAAEAEASRIAGEQCERDYDALRAGKK